MDIKLPSISSLTPTSTLITPNNSLADLNLKVGQPLDAKVINTLITTTQNTISLKIGNQTVTVLVSEPLNLQPGQNLALQVTKVTPSIEFKLLPQLTEVTSNPVLITLLPQSAPLTQQVQAKVVGLTGNQIQLQLPLSTELSAHSRPKLVTLNIDQSSLLLPTKVMVGQQVLLDIIHSDKKTEYRLNTHPDNLIETKLSTLIKQLLPRQASPISLIDQLHKDLSLLITNEAVPQSLKRAVLDILQNLPQKEQLFTGQHLEKLISNSGVFQEAKLPLLIKNELLGRSLKEIAISLLQKLPQPPPSKIISTDDLVETLFKADFKTNLGKLLQVLNQEISTKNELATSSPQLEVLKALHQKVENSMAKIVLEQLVSLPKEDSPKQLWQINIAFLDQEKAQTAELEIQMNKEKDQLTAVNNWSVTINIAPPGIGSIHCVIASRNEVISTYFKAQKVETADLISDNLEHLKEQLEEQGLKVGHMNANEGSLQKNTTSSGQTQGRKLFDDHA